jgi:hypothetical protein
MTMIHATVAPGAQVRLPWRPEFNGLAYVLSGRGQFGPERRQAGAGQLVVFGPGQSLTFTAHQTQDSRTPNLDVLVLGGRPIREQVAWYGPFVMNTEDEIRQALEDFQRGKLGTIPADGLQPYRPK